MTYNVLINECRVIQKISFQLECMCLKVMLIVTKKMVITCSCTQNLYITFRDYFTNCCGLVFHRYVELYLPKFSVSADASLDNTLKEMGITNAFGGNADFSGMSDTIRLEVSKVGNANIS